MSQYVDITGKYGQEMDETIKKMTTQGKGLLAADESTGTIGKRFKPINVENVESNRQAYRQLLFTAPEEYAKYISGVIMYEETLFQKTDDGTPFVNVLNKHGVVPGIKVDKGVKPIYGNETETTTQGLDGLDERVAKYYEQGARFAKWRAVYRVSESLPTDIALTQNAEGLARYAAICQQGGLVPIVEPEVMVMEGSHDIERSYKVTVRVLSAVFRSLIEHNVNIHRMILKPNMVLPGDDCPKKSQCDKRIAEYTVKALQATVPPAVRGIMFLSGGQNEEQAVQTLNAINKVEGAKPWTLSYSYGRALQSSALKAWQGKKDNIVQAQKEYVEQAKKCSQASTGSL